MKKRVITEAVELESGVSLIAGEVHPEKLVQAKPGSIYLRASASDTYIYLKATGTGFEGWVSLRPDPPVLAAAQPANATADAPAISAAYVQAEVQAVATLANSLKADLNALLQKLKDAPLMQS